jgi:PucR C-terminal helix-turn-helix domain
VDTPVAAAAPAAAPWRRLPADVASALRPVLDQTARAVSAEVKASVPAFAAIRGSAKFSRDLDAAVRAGLERFVDLVATDEEALTPVVRELFTGLGAAEARDGRGPEILLSALRISSRLLLRAAVDAVAGSRSVQAGEVVDLSDAITGFIDELTSACTDGYARQVREDAGESDRLRRHLAGLLLRGGAAGPVVARASAAIGWPPPERVTAVLVPAAEARAARFRFAADGVLAERGDDAVLLLRKIPPRAELSEALHGRRAVVGPTLDWEQVPTAVQLAELTARPAPGEPPAFTDDHLADLALRGQPAALAVLARRRLGGLSGLRPAQRETLLRTLRSWLWHWGSRSEVAAALFVHPQTVSYRIAQLRQLLDADLDDPRVRFELLLAVSSETGTHFPA